MPSIPLIIVAGIFGGFAGYGAWQAMKPKPFVTCDEPNGCTDAITAAVCRSTHNQLDTEWTHNQTIVLARRTDSAPPPEVLTWHVTIECAATQPSPTFERPPRT